MRWLYVLWQLCLAVLLVNVCAAEEVLASYRNVPAYKGRQCVEYVRRFLKQTQNYALPPLGAGEQGNAKYVFPRVQQGKIQGLQAFPNSGVIPPQPDDVLCLDHPTAAGHVAIVTAVTSGRVRIIEQNWPGSGSAELSLRVVNGQYLVGDSNGKRSSYTIQGWCRVKSNATVQPRYSLLLLDVSEQRGERFSRALLEAVVRAFLDRHRSGDVVAVLMYAYFTDILLHPAHVPVGEDRIKKVVRGLAAQDGEELGGSLTGSLNLRDERGRRPRVVLVSKGWDSSGKIDQAIAMSLKLQSPVTVIAIGVQPNRTVLRKIASQTKGQYFEATESTIASIMQQALP